MIVEPHISALPESLQAPKVELMALTDAIHAADIVLLLVNHRAFYELPHNDLMAKIVIDTRGIWSA